jgi:GT2 family glycosyltransferase
MKTKVDLSIITVNYNGLDDTCGLIHSVRACYFTFSYELIVVDNGSKSDEAKLIRDQFPSIEVVRSNENVGFAGGNNLGLRYANGEFIYFLNNDTLLPENANEEIHNMLGFLRENPTIGGISPKIMFVVPPNQVQFAGSTPLSGVTLRNYQIGYQQEDDGSFNRQKAIPYLHGAAMMVPKRVITEIGHMPECYFLYYEEVDWSRMIRQKYELRYFPGATVFHKESASTGFDSPFKIFYLTRNRLIYALRNRTGGVRMASILYQIGIAAPIHIVKYSLNAKFAQAIAISRGICHFFLFLLKRK